MSNYVSSLTSLRITSTYTILGSGFFFFGNLSHVLFGQVPMIQNSGIEVDNQTKARMWLYMFERAKVSFSAAALSTAIAFGGISYLVRSNTVLLRVAIVGTLSSAFIGPWTINQMMPTNNVLTEISQGEAKGKAMEQYTDKLIEKWRQKHNVRMVAGFVSLACALAIAQSDLITAI